MTELPTDLGSVWVCNHAKDRIAQHGIDTEYAHGLIERVEQWNLSGGRAVGRVEKDGVLWRVVLETDKGDTKHNWDLITTVPEEVNTTKAMNTDRWDETQVLNLKLYSNQK